MSDLIKRDDALDILCKSCGISEDVEKCRKTSADGWCKEYCELKNMPSVEAIPVEFIKDLHKEAIAYRDRLNPVWQNRSWNRADEQAIGINSVLQVWDDRHG